MNIEQIISSIIQNPFDINNYKLLRDFYKEKNMKEQYECLNNYINDQSDSI